MSERKGEDVAEMWERGEQDDIVVYCASDVVGLVELFMTRSQRLSKCVRMF